MQHRIGFENPSGPNDALVLPVRVDSQYLSTINYITILIPEKDTLQRGALPLYTNPILRWRGFAPTR